MWNSIDQFYSIWRNKENQNDTFSSFSVNRSQFSLLITCATPITSPEESLIGMQSKAFVRYPVCKSISRLKRSSCNKSWWVCIVKQKRTCTFRRTLTWYASGMLTGSPLSATWPAIPVPQATRTSSCCTISSSVLRGQTSNNFDTKHLCESLNWINYKFNNSVNVCETRTFDFAVC